MKRPPQLVVKAKAYLVNEITQEFNRGEYKSRIKQHWFNSLEEAEAFYLQDNDKGVE